MRQKRLTDLRVRPPDGRRNGRGLRSESKQFGQSFALAENPIPHLGAVAGGGSLNDEAGVGAGLKVEVEAADARPVIQFSGVSMVERRLETREQQARNDGGMQYQTHLSEYNTGEMGAACQWVPCPYAAS